MNKEDTIPTGINLYETKKIADVLLEFKAELMS